MKITFDTTNQSEVMEVQAYLNSLSADAPVEPPKPKAAPKAKVQTEPPPHDDSDAPPLSPAEMSDKPAPAPKAEPKAKAAPKPKETTVETGCFDDKTGEDLRHLAAGFLSSCPAEQKVKHRTAIVEGILKAEFGVTSSADLSEKDVPKAFELIFNYIEDNQ